MLRLFLPLYIILTVYTFFYKDIYGYVISEFLAEEIAEDTEVDYSGFFKIVFDFLETKNPEDWKSVINSYSTENVPLDIIDIDDKRIDGETLKKLYAGKIVSDIDDDYSGSIMVKVPKHKKVLVVGPTETIDTLEESIFAILLIGNVLIVGMIFLWGQTVRRKINHLMSMAQQFGAGNFSARASTKPSKRVGDLNRSFNLMAERIEELINSHKMLTNAVSHELKTPIARMQFELAYAQEHQSLSQYQASLNSIDDDVNELELLVSELLSYAKYDRHELLMRIEPHALNEWLYEWQQSFKPIHAPDIALDVMHLDNNGSRSDWFNQQQTTPPDSAHNATPNVMSSEHKGSRKFDAHAMERLLDNLVNNALRYAKSQVVVRIELQAKSWTLVVEDDGVGIPEDKRSFVFEPFARLDKSRNRQTGGVGLGLAIVKQIVNHHHGEIHIDDSPLGGARFSVHLHDE